MQRLSSKRVKTTLDRLKEKGVIKNYEFKRIEKPWGVKMWFIEVDGKNAELVDLKEVATFIVHFIALS